MRVPSYGLLTPPAEASLAPDSRPPTPQRSPREGRQEVVRGEEWNGRNAFTTPSFLEIGDYQSDLDGLRLAAGRMGGDSES